jgi:hypothetical protein
LVRDDYVWKNRNSMEEVIVSFGKTSKSTFENYLQIIEKKRIIEVDENKIKSYDLLEKLILLLERTIQDTHENLNFSKENEKINSILTEILKVQYQYLNFFSDDKDVIDSFSYSLLAVSNILRNSSRIKLKFTYRYLYKIFPTNKLKKYISPDNIRSETSKNLRSLRRLKLESKKIIDKVLYEKYIKDYFKLDSLKNYFDLSIEEIDEKSRKYNLSDKIESLYHLKNDDEIFEWSVYIRFSDSKEKYSAKKISNLVFIISSSFESIENVEAVLDNWGVGSRWVNLIVKIKKSISKEGIIDIIKELRRWVEVYYLKKPYGEIKNSELTAKIKENELNTDEKNGFTEASRELEIEKVKIEIERKKLENERIKIENEAEKIKNIVSFSELIKEGIIQIDSDLQIIINECLYLNIKNGEYQFSDLKTIEEIEGSEEINSSADIDKL